MKSPASGPGSSLASGEGAGVRRIPAAHGARSRTFTRTRMQTRKNEVLVATRSVPIVGREMACFRHGAPASCGSPRRVTLRRTSVSAEQAIRTGRRPVTRCGQTEPRFAPATFRPVRHRPGAWPTLPSAHSRDPHSRVAVSLVGVGGATAARPQAIARTLRAAVKVLPRRSAGVPVATWPLVPVSVRRRGVRARRSRLGAGGRSPLTGRRPRCRWR